jgi:hypothetical protein
MPLVVSTVPPFPGLSDWEYLINFRPSAATQLAINARFGLSRLFHPLEDGLGPISLDYYPVRVSAMPGMQAAELLEYVRRNINHFIDKLPIGCEFNLYEPLIDGPAWAPLFLDTGFPGALLSIDFYGYQINVDDGSVALTEITPDHWIFSTLWTPGDLHHPVSGNRWFGFQPTVAGEFIFYTRAADRLTTWVDEVAAETVFAGADSTWRSFQARLATFVNSNGGMAVVEAPTVNRYDWPSVQASYWHPTEVWV